MKFCLFYGSLRKGTKGAEGKKTFNFDRFGEGSQTYLKTLTIDGYDLYDLKWYPAIAKGAGKLTVELHEVEDDAAAAIARMERGAGYDEVKVKITGTEPSSDIHSTPLEGYPVEATLYAYTTPLEGHPKIESGDWLENE